MKKELVRRVITKRRSVWKDLLTSVLAVSLGVMIVTSVSASSLVPGNYAPSYCVIGDIHVSSVTPTGYASTTVQVITTFSVSCTGGTQGTVWDIQTNVYAESNLVGISTLSTSDNQYSFGEGTAQYVVNSQFDAMSYFGYGEQVPSFYVQITVINTSTRSLDAQEQVPFAVDTSQYPFNLVQQNYCNFPGLSQFFQLLPGCGGSTSSTTPVSSNCNTYGLPQFLQPYLPGCTANSNGVTPANQTGPSNEEASSTQSSSQPSPTQPSTQPSPQQPGNPFNPTTTYPSLATDKLQESGRSIEWIVGIIIATLATFLLTALAAIRTAGLNYFRFRTRRTLQGKFCTACGIKLQINQNFCGRCGEPCPINEAPS